MKNLTCILSFSAVLGLAILAAPAALGVSLPYENIASGVLGASCGMSLLGFFFADYAPHRRPDYLASRLPEARRRAAPPASIRRRTSRPIDPSFDDMITINLFFPIEMRNDPSTASMI